MPDAVCYKRVARPAPFGIRNCILKFAQCRASLLAPFPHCPLQLPRIVVSRTT